MPLHVRVLCCNYSISLAEAALIDWFQRNSS
jgi:hypothetical protein